MVISKSAIWVIAMFALAENFANYSCNQPFAASARSELGRACVGPISNFFISSKVVLNSVTLHAVASFAAAI